MKKSLVAGVAGILGMFMGPRTPGFSQPTGVPKPPRSRRKPTPKVRFGRGLNFRGSHLGARQEMKLERRRKLDLAAARKNRAWDLGPASRLKE